MKYKLIGVHLMNIHEGKKDETNIGDYIQSLASAQFCPSIDGFINREELKSYDGEECKMIMNGWYMFNVDEWPPSSKIIPLFVALHFNTLAKEKLLSEESINYLKQHEPIGCRDKNTEKMLREHGVNAYFSGCMTLTLGRKYHSDIKDGKYYFVDPYFVTHWNIKNVIRNAFYLLFHWRPINKIAKKFPGSKKGLRKRMILTTFYREYSKLFSKKILVNAQYINHQNEYYAYAFPTDEQRLAEAERLVKNYAKAKLVVTSRIHCALPCLGLETPVIYTYDEQQSEASSCRMDGIVQLFNCVRWDKDRLRYDELSNSYIDENTQLKNKETWRPLAVALTKRCIAFCNSKE